MKSSVSTTSVMHRFSLSCSGHSNLMRIDSRINRFLMKNGLDRGILSIKTAEAVITALPYVFPAISSYPSLYEQYRQTAEGSPFAGQIRGGELSLPVNMGQLVVGDVQNLAVFPVAGNEEVNLELTFVPVTTILKLSSISCRNSGQIFPLAAKVNRELHDPEGRGRVYLATPNTTALLLPLSGRNGTAFLDFLNGLSVPEGEGFYTASYRSALFGQWGQMRYENGWIAEAGSDKLSLVHLGDEPIRHDIYILQVKED